MGALVLHTTFQQNKDCNGSSSDGNSAIEMYVAYDLPAKQGLQHLTRHKTQHPQQRTVAYDLPAKQGLQLTEVLEQVRVGALMLHTTFQQNKDCNTAGASRPLLAWIVSLHTTFQQNKDCNPAVSSVEP